MRSVLLCIFGVIMGFYVEHARCQTTTTWTAKCDLDQTNTIYTACMLEFDTTFLENQLLGATCEKSNYQAECFRRLYYDSNDKHCCQGTDLAEHHKHREAPALACATDFEMLCSAGKHAVKSDGTSVRAGAFMTVFVSMFCLFLVG